MNTNTTSNATSNNNAWIYTFFLKKHYQRNIIVNRIWIDVKLMTIENQIVLMINLNNNSNMIYQMKLNWF